MIDELRSFALCVAASGILVAVIDTISPSGKNGKAVKFITSIFIILMVLSPITKLLSSFSASFPERSAPTFKVEAVKDISDELLLSEIERKISKVSVDIVKNGTGITIEIESVGISKDEDGNILVREIVYFNVGHQEKIEKVLSDSFGCPKVIAIKRGD